MNESLLSLLSEVTLFDLLLAIMLILVLVSILITQKKRFRHFLTGGESKRMRMIISRSLYMT